MKKLLWTAVLIAFVALPLSPQSNLPLMHVGSTASGCTTPTGTHVTESFGDSSTLCWTSGPSTCNNTWTIVNGSAESIVSSPASAPANTACANSLQMNLSGTANTGIISLGFTAVTPPVDMKGTVYLLTLPTSGNGDMIACFAAASGSCSSSTTNIASLIIDNNDICAGVGFRGDGSTNSACVTSIVVNTWYTFDIHVDATAASCSMSINGGTAQTFTCNSGNPGTAEVGPVSSSNAVAYKYDIGNINW